MGGTKNPDVERIIALGPDLVIANREENRREDVERLEEAGLRVLVTHPDTVREAIEMTRELGGILDAADRVAGLIEEVDAALERPPLSPAPRVLVPIWRRPFMALGSQSYGHDLLQCAGALNVFADTPRYPETTVEEIAARRPDLILLPDEPYPFKPEHAAELSHIAPVIPVDGKLLWWYGPRMPRALREIRRLISQEPA